MLFDRDGVAGGGLRLRRGQVVTGVEGAGHAVTAGRGGRVVSVGRLGAGFVVVALSVGMVTGCASPGAGPSATASERGAQDVGSGAPVAGGEEAEAPYGFASYALPGSANREAYDGFPGEGWWTTWGVEVEKAQAHPDTLLVAGWNDEIIEGYRRDPESNDVTVVAASAFGKVPVDPDWADAWLILDAHTHEVVEVPWAPGDDPAPWVVPEGFTELPAAEAEGFAALASDFPGLATTVSGDGEVIGVRAVDGDGFGFMVRFDATDPIEVPSTHSREPYELTGFTATTVSGEAFADWHLSALSETQDCSFSISAIAPQGASQAPDPLATYITDDLPHRITTLCPTP